MITYNLFHLKMLINDLGEDRVKSILNNFCSPYNEDIENFIKDKAIEFAKQGWSQTYLVFLPVKNIQHFVGYFTLANKDFTIQATALKSSNNKTSKISSDTKKRIKQFGVFYKEINAYRINAPLIAQLAKNFDNKNNDLITGDELLKIACDQVKEVHNLVGGKIVYLECEDILKLKDFYSENGFVEFGKRKLDYDEKPNLKGEYLIQMLKVLK